MTRRLWTLPLFIVGTMTAGGILILIAYWFSIVFGGLLSDAFNLAVWLEGRFGVWGIVGFSFAVASVPAGVYAWWDFSCIGQENQGD